MQVSQTSDNNTVHLCRANSSTANSCCGLQEHTLVNRTFQLGSSGLHLHSPHTSVLPWHHICHSSDRPHTSTAGIIHNESHITHSEVPLGPDPLLSGLQQGEVLSCPTPPELVSHVLNLPPPPAGVGCQGIELVPTSAATSSWESAPPSLWGHRTPWSAVFHLWWLQPHTRVSVGSHLSSLAPWEEPPRPFGSFWCISPIYLHDGMPLEGWISTSRLAERTLHECAADSTEWCYFLNSVPKITYLCSQLSSKEQTTRTSQEQFIVFGRDRTVVPNPTAG